MCWPWLCRLGRARFPGEIDAIDSASRSKLPLCFRRKFSAGPSSVGSLLLRSRELPDKVQKQRDFESDASHQISVDSALPLHRLVDTTKELLSRKPVPPGTLIPLDVRVSKKSQDRALRLLSTVVYALEERGFSVEGASPKRESGVFIIKGESLRFGLEERHQSYCTAL
jgi:hypothetical protein